jgi:hypothetical protein
MYRRDYRDLVGGGFLFLVGLFIVGRASLYYDLGTVRHLGPGMYPVWVGCLLAGLGALIAILGLFRQGKRISPDYRQFAAVVLGLVMFGLTISSFGMIPAVFILTIAAVVADNKLGIVGALVLAAVLSLIALVIFRLILSVPLEAFRWPF